MSLMLTRFSQEVDLANGSLDVLFFAIFSDGSGKELRLPITEEGSKAIIAFYADSSVAKEAVARPSGIVLHDQPTPQPMTEEMAKEARVFGDEEDEEEMYEGDEEPPYTEEEVPSL